jgi:hypothetical protein
MPFNSCSQKQAEAQPSTRIQQLLWITGPFFDTAPWGVLAPSSLFFFETLSNIFSKNDSTREDQEGKEPFLYTRKKISHPTHEAVYKGSPTK